MNPKHFGRNFDPGVYNTLPSLGEADAAVRVASRLEDFLKEAAKVFKSHNMQSRFGVALMHSHSQIEKGERMIEFSERIDNRDALVTRPSLKDPCQEEASPIVWQLRDGQFSPLEFSTDPLACSLLHEGEIPDAFLNRFSGLVSRSPIGKYVGLAVVSREFYNSAVQEEIPVEFTNTTDRSNIVLLCNRNEAPAHKLVETAWSFGNTADFELHCASNCRKQCYWQDDEHVELPHQKHHTPNPD